jgi:arginine decarboxylase
MPTPLVRALEAWTDLDHAPFYTPGHKHGRGMGTDFADLLQSAGLKSDLPELPGLDNLAAPSGAIAESQAFWSPANPATRFCCPAIFTDQRSLV